MNKIEALAYAEERLDKISYHLEMTNQLPCRSFYEKQQDMLIKATQALRAQQERENPKPLTLEELREMDEEPVWCVWLDTQKSGMAYSTCRRNWGYRLKIGKMHCGIVNTVKHGLPTPTRQRRTRYEQYRSQCLQAEI